VTKRTRPASGFTLLEIMIAIVILAVGIMGVLALHTATIQTSSAATNEAFISNLARSVDAAIHEGATQRSFILQEGTSFVKGFVLRHDGVTAGKGLPPTTTPQGVLVDDGTWPPHTILLQQIRGADDVIFLPSAPTSGTPDPIFVYPRPNGAAADNPDLGALAGVDNWLAQGVPGYDRTVFLDVKRTYVPTPPRAAPQPFDPAQLYSFALVIRRASVPTLAAPRASAADTLKLVAGDPGPSLLASTGARTDGLYEVQVLIYRAFDASPLSPHHTEVHRSMTLLAMGP
jgi:prepilin-type N-terminal cleavage/methylation domain-containing protein